MIERLSFINLPRRTYRRELETEYYSGKKMKLPPVAIPADKDVLLKNFPVFRYLYHEKIRSAIEPCIDEALHGHIERESAAKQQKCYTLNDGSSYTPDDQFSWQADPVSGHIFPEEIVWRIDYQQHPKYADFSNAWALSDHRQLYACLFDYILNGRPEPGGAVLAQFEDFTRRNPPAGGIHWISTYEIAQRLITFIFLVPPVLDHETASAERIAHFFDTVLHYAVFLEHETGDDKYPDHSQIAAYAALFLASLVLGGEPYFRRLREKAIQGLEREIRRQILPDGISYLQSVPAFYVSLEAFSLARFCAHNAGISFSAEYDDRLHRMFRVLSDYRRDDNSLPQLGDAVRIPLFPYLFPVRECDPVALLGLGAYLFNDGKLKYSPAPPLIIPVLLGKEAVDAFRRIPYTSEEKTYSVGYTDGGHFIFRNELCHFFIKTAGIGRQGHGAPGHNDTFTFELLYREKLFFTDTGTYSLYADADQRNLMRSIRQHNSFYIDNQQLAEFSGLTDIKSDLTKPKILKWQMDNEEDSVSAQHFAFVRLQDPVVCKRTVQFQKMRNKFKIKDEFIGGESHRISTGFFLHPGVTIEKESPTAFLLQHGTAALRLRFTLPADQFITSVTEAPYSPRYGVLETTRKINLVIVEKLPCFNITEIELL